MAYNIPHKKPKKKQTYVTQKTKKKFKLPDETGKGFSVGETKSNIILKLCNVYPEGIDTSGLAGGLSKPGFTNNHLLPLKNNYEFIHKKGEKYKRIKRGIKFITRHPKWHIKHNQNNFYKITKFIIENKKLSQFLKTTYFNTYFNKCFFTPLFKKLIKAINKHSKPKVNPKQIFVDIVNYFKYSPTTFERFFKLFNKSAEEIAKLLSPIEERLTYEDIRSYIKTCLIDDQLEGYKNKKLKMMRIIFWKNEQMDTKYKNIGKKVEEKYLEEQFEKFQEKEAQYYNNHPELWGGDAKK